MDVRKKLVEILRRPIFLHELVDPNELVDTIEVIADCLIDSGVTVQELDGCIRCKDSQQMTVTISNKLVDGVNTGWLGGNLPARFCPFCGRRLSQPPKGELLWRKMYHL